MTAGQWQDMFIYSAYIAATSLCALSFTFTSVWSFASGLTHSSDLHPFLAVDCNFKPVDEGWQSLLVHLRGRGGGSGVVLVGGWSCGGKKTEGPRGAVGIKGQSSATVPDSGHMAPAD